MKLKTILAFSILALNMLSSQGVTKMKSSVNDKVPTKFELEMWREIVEGIQKSEGYKIVKDGDDIKVFHKPWSEPYKFFEENAFGKVSSKDFKKLWDFMVKDGVLKKDYSRIEPSKGEAWHTLKLSVEEKTIIDYSNHMLSDEGGKLFEALWKKVKDLPAKKEKP